MKRFLSILLAVVMVMSLAVPAFASRFRDIEDSDYANAIEHLAGLGVIAGYEDGTFKPEKVVTRAEMAKMLVVCLGLEAGASLLEGTSEFDDVPETHWATGYIAVAAQYGLIKGDGDGNFRPDDTVNISEAATMVLRALGYNRVVDKAGEWPTNYLNKSNELDIFEDVGDFKGTDGATRGIIAQMMWNMLGTEMWEILGESEGDGLTYHQGDTMLGSKFPKYTFVESMLFESYDVKEDRNNNAIVTLDFGRYVIGENEDGDNIYLAEELIYAGNDFYTFVLGTEFEGLIYEGKDGYEAITLFITENNNLVEGRANELAEEYDAIDKYFAQMYGEGYDARYFADTYVYALLDGTKSTSDFKIVTRHDEYIDFEQDVSITKITSNSSSYLESIEETKDGLEYVETRNNEDSWGSITIPNDATVIVIKDGERVSIDELKVGTVFSVIGWHEDDPSVIVISDKTVEGTVTKYVEDTGILTLGGEKYFTSWYATYIDNKDDEDSESYEWEFADFTDYKNENAKIYLDMLGNVLRLEFGELSEKTTNGAFFVVANNAWMVSNEDGAEYKIKLTDMNGETKTYTFAEDVEPNDMFEYALNNNLKNELLWVEFDEKLIANFMVVVQILETEPMDEHDELDLNIYITGDSAYGDGCLTDPANFDPNDEDSMKFIEANAVDFDENKLYWTNEFDYEENPPKPVYSNYVKITDSTKLVKIITEYDYTEKEITYAVEIETGKDAFKGIEGFAGVVTTGEFANAKYVFTWNDNTTSDFMYGLVDSIEYDEVNEETIVVLIDENGKEEEFVVSNLNEAEEGTIVAYVLNSKNEVDVKEFINLRDVVWAKEVTSVDDDKRMALIEDIGITDLDDETFQDENDFDKDTTIIIGKIGLDKDDMPEFTGFEVMAYDDYKFAEKDYIELSFDENILGVYRLSSEAYNSLQAYLDFMTNPELPELPEPPDPPIL